MFGERKRQEYEWKLGGKTIEQVNNYKYLGLVVKENLRWDKFKQRMLEKAKRSSVKSWAMGIRSGILTVINLAQDGWPQEGGSFFGVILLSNSEYFIDLTSEASQISF